MRQASSKPTKIDPWAAMDALMAKNPEPMGKEWMTTNEIAARYGISYRNAHANMMKQLTLGKVERWMGRRTGGKMGGPFSKWKVK